MATPGVPVNLVTSHTADIDVQQLSSDLSNAVEQVKAIQVLIARFVSTIVVRKNDEVEKETQAIKATIQKVHSVKSELGKIAARYSKLRLNNIHPVPLGNSGYISLDPTEDRNGFYQQLIESYTWIRNLDHDATKLHNLLRNKYSLETKSTQPEGNTLIDIFNQIKVEFSDMLVNDKFLMTDSCIELQVASTFVLYMFFSGLHLSFVLVKSVNEMFDLEILEQSNYQVFKKLTDLFTAVLLKLPSNNCLTLVKQFVEHVISFRNVFNTKCKGCSKYLALDATTKYLFPPLWKNVDSPDFYHISCHMTYALDNN